jgi:hypothetical protein
MTIRVIESESWNGITIGLIDAILSVAKMLNERIAAETKRLKLTDEEWLSEEVQEALADLRHSADIKMLIAPENEKAMAIIREAAALIKTREVPVA